MVKPVAYVGIGTQQNPNIQAPTKIDTPQYPDKGVSYAGYSKIAMSGNQFQLNPQEIVNYHYDTGSKVAVEVIEVLNDVLPNGKTLYITSLQIYFSILNLVADSFIKLEYFSSAGYVTIWGVNILRNGDGLVANFPTPLKFDNTKKLDSFATGLQLHYSTGAANTINNISFNFQGWIE